MRSGGLAGQTFEIEIISALSPRTPAILRGYVTVTRFFTREDDPDDLEHYAARLSELMVRYGRDEPPAYPPGCTPLAVICLDTHEGHFMGRGRNRLLAYELDGQAYLRAAGTWDDMPVTLEQAYRSAGPQGAAGLLGRRAAGVEHAPADRAADGVSGATATTRSSSARGRTG